MLNILDFTYLENSQNIGLSLVLINIINYLLVFLTIISLILFSNISRIKNINQFKEFNSFNFIYYTIIFSLLSMAGIPPLLGFTGKFLSILILSFKSQHLLLFLTLILNMFGMYFYIQNLRFVVKKKKSSILLYRNFYISINYSLVNIVFILNLLNIFGFLFLTDFLIILNFITTNLFIN